MTRPLRIGLLIDGTRLKRWEAWCLQDLMARDDLLIAVAISNPVSSAPEPRPRRAARRLRALPRRAHEVPWMVLDRFDRWFARGHYSGAAMDDVDLAALPGRIPFMEATPEISRSGTIHRFTTADIASVRSWDLDLLLRFGYNVLKGPLLDTARYGIWSFHHADNQLNRGGPPGFWEIARDQPVTGVTLQRLTDQLDNGAVLARGWYATDTTSWNRNHQRVAAQGRTLLTDAVGYLARHGEMPAAPRNVAPIYCHPLYRTPTATAAVTTAIRGYSRPVKRKLRARVTREQWHLRWGAGDSRDLSIHRLHRITPPPDRFWADPFPYTRDGRYWLFTEEFIYRTGRGRIVALEVAGDRVVDHTVVLDPPLHLSYPFLFDHDGDLYMIPETSANETIELWRCSRFPDRWEKVHDILSGVSATDTSLLEHGGRCYLFTNLARTESGNHNNELHIFHAGSPLDRSWRAHEANPVIVDSRCARMAGGFIAGADERPIRCAQRCGSRYGEAIVLRAIETLTPQRYAEHTAGHVTPAWERGLLATHHLGENDGIVALDACTSIPRWHRPSRAHSLAMPGGNRRTPADRPATT